MEFVSFLQFLSGDRTAFTLAMAQTKLLLASFTAAFCAFAQVGEEVVKKDSISVHTVERGSMPIFAFATGKLTSLQPARAILHFDGNDGVCEQGRNARLVLGDSPRALAGKVTKPIGPGNCEVEIIDKLPGTAEGGTKAEGLIESRQLKDVVFFGRPASSKENSTAAIFVLDGPSAARRVTVRYGAMSGPLIQVLNGLVPGDKVIVTDMSKWAHLPRVRLE
ncbi:MAG: hypothetical protein JNL98_30555 [Bryobacterales bacterium]|nr:hypothetical protein [Bryobacterales bacterium]